MRKKTQTKQITVHGLKGDEIRGNIMNLAYLKWKANRNEPNISTQRLYLTLQFTQHCTVFKRTRER